MLVTAQDVNQRMDRYKWVLVEIDNGTDTLDNPIREYWIDRVGKRTI